MIKIRGERAVWVNEAQVVSVSIRTQTRYRNPLKETEPYTSWYVRVETNHDTFNSADFDTEEGANVTSEYIIRQIDCVNQARD